MSNTQSKIYFIIGAVLVIGLILGYIWGSFSSQEKAFNQGLDQGRKEIEEKYQTKIEELYPTVPEPEEIFSVSGEIKEIKDETLTVETTYYPVNPFEETKTETKTVRITEATEFVKQVQKSPEELEKEGEAFRKAMEETPEAAILPPEPFKELTISFSDLKVGDRITIEAEENIKGKTEFGAKKIILWTAPE